jgi:hypothetical protein
MWCSGLIQTYHNVEPDLPDGYALHSIACNPVVQSCRVPAIDTKLYGQCLVWPSLFWDLEGQYRKPGDEKKGFNDHFCISLLTINVPIYCDSFERLQLDPRRPFTVHSLHTGKWLSDQRYLGPRSPNQSHPSSHPCDLLSRLLLLSVLAIVTSSSSCS